MLSKPILVIALVSCCPPSSGQANPGCMLDTAKDGVFLTMRGEVFPTGHDTFIRPIRCDKNTSNRVIIIWGDDASLKEGTIVVDRNADFLRFNRLVGKTIPLPPNSMGVGKSRYRITADFEGRLDVAPSSGLIRDPKSQKAIGIEGFGHPMPFTRFRLVVRSVSNIEAIEP